MIQDPIYTKVSGELILPYASPTGTSLPIEKGRVIYKRGYVTPAGSYVAMAEQITAPIVDGVVEERSLLTGSVWRVTIEPIGVSYRHQFHFITEGEKQNLSDVIPVRIDGLDYVRGEAGIHIVSIEVQEAERIIHIAMSDGETFTFPLPHAALDEADRAVLDNALETFNAGTITIEELATTLQANVDSTSAELQSNLQALADAVVAVSSDRESIAQDRTKAERAAGDASTSAQNALQHSEDAYGYTQTAQGLLDALRDGIASGDFKGAPGASVVGGRDNGDGTVSFELSDGTYTDAVVLPPGPAGRGIVSISNPDTDSRVTVTFTDGSTATVQAIRGADGHTPTIAWEGTSLVVDGQQGPDLKGEPGADSNVPGPAPTVSWDGDRLVVEGVKGPSLTGPTGLTPTVAWSGDRLVVGGVQGPSLTGPVSTTPGPIGPPGAVPTASDYLVVGPGRPDAPTTTGLSSAQIAALPIGCEYRSTDGASVGAWVWRKRPTGWVVTDGDTGRVDVTASLLNGWGVTTGKAYLQRIGRMAYFSGAFKASPSYFNNQQLFTLPAGFRSAADDWAGGASGAMGPNPSVVMWMETPSIIKVSGATSNMGWLRAGLSIPTNDPWPTSLPV